MRVSYTNYLEPAALLNSPNFVVYFLLVALYLFIFLIIATVSVVFLAMLTHGIFNYLQSNKNSTINPMLATIFLFIPFAGPILNALNYKKALKIEGANSQIAKNYLYLEIVSLVLFVPITFYTIFNSFRLSATGVKPLYGNAYLTSFEFVSNVVIAFVGLIASALLFSVISKTVAAIKNNAQN